MPGTPFETGWYIEKLLAEYITAHTAKESKSFAGTTFSEYGMSLGHQQVLQAKHIVAIISGEKKKALATELLSYTSFTPSFPLSIIYHPKVQDKVEIFLTEDILRK
jgi:6-phosphogluconolactonase/glucosamine-6-phosphate isomerase/deaminase